MINRGAGSHRWRAAFGMILLIYGVEAGGLGRAAVQSGTESSWWSLQPLRCPDVPLVSKEREGWARNPVDAFILAKLERQGLAPAPEAARRVLIRRVYYDLIGLPPTPEAVEVFVKDPDELAYEKMVDQLLDSPRYGERWARHWLDVVHYGDTHGYDKDKPRPNAWPYRDYVIRAFNSDKPYSRFVQEQLAGDRLFPGTVDGIEALGFIAAGPWDFIGHAEVPESKTDGQIARMLDRDDMVSNTINTFSSLTVHCARCHDHKFDPIKQEDYYSLQAVFAALDRADRPYDADPLLAAKRRELQEQQESLLAKQEVFDKKILLDRPAPAEIREQAEQNRQALAAVGSLLKGLPPPRLVYAGTIYSGTGPFRGTGPDGGRPREIHVLYRGDVGTPGAAVGPGAIAAVPGLEGRFDISDDRPEGDRRAALAVWLTDPDNPLTWRSIVNRVWLYHFGRGMVDTPNDFGRMGQLPSHPEMLDWLAAQFRDQGQSLKWLHRLMVTSATYRQASSVAPDVAARAAESDGSNTLLWRMNRRRLEAEAIRDGVLQVSGQLRLGMYGPGFEDFVIEKPEHSPHYEYELADPDNPKTHRRSVYRFIVRSQQQPFMRTLDCADPSMLVDKRNESLSALQALALLNNGFMLTMARHFAAKLESGGGTGEDQVDRGFAEALGRQPSAREKAMLIAYALKHGLPNTCRVLFNMNEFVFVD